MVREISKFFTEEEKNIAHQGSRDPDIALKSKEVFVLHEHGNC